MVADMKFLEQGCVKFLDSLLTEDRSSRRDKDRILREERSLGGCVVLVERLVILYTERINLLGYRPYFFVGRERAKQS
jgi:hypothetical protein